MAGYNLGLLVEGSNTIPATVSTFIEGTNTVEGVKQTNFASTTITTVIDDPDNAPGTGDETATDGQFTVVYDDLTFTASGADGSTIEFREDTRYPLVASPQGSEVGGIIIRAVIGGFLNVRFACSPGTVTPPDPGTVTPIDPAAAFATTLIQAPVVDDPPTADAGADQTVDEGDLVTLDGSLSSDPNGEDLTYAWTAPAGITLTGADTANPTFTAPQVDANTPFAFVLQVCDEAPTVLCDTDTVVVNVLDVPEEDLAPTADAGADQTVDEGVTVTLDGSGSSDPNAGEALTYAWTQTGGTTVTLTGANTATPSFTAPDVGPAGEQLTFSLEVCDEANPVSLCATDSTAVNVQDVVVPASTISINNPAAVIEGGAVSFTVSLSAAQAETVTVDYATSDGTATAPGDYTSATGTVTFAPGDISETVIVQTIDDADFAEADTETFNVTLSTVTGNATIADGTGVGSITDNDVAPPMVDAATEVIVNGPVGPSTRKTSKSFVIKVSNDGTAPLTITAADLTTSVEVNGVVTGTVSVAGLPVTLGPGSSKRLKATWNYASGAFAAGDTIDFNACVDLLVT